MKNAISKIEGLTYGVELEYEKISKEVAVRALERLFGTHAQYVGTYLDAWAVPMPDGRMWKVENDGSLDTGCETVSPVLTLADMDTLQNVVRALRHAGAKVRNTCGLHIHVGAGDMTPKHLVNLMKIWHVEENFITKACGVVADRLAWFTRPSEIGFVRNAAKIKKPTWKQLADIYYRGNETLARPRSSHYCAARYRTVNLHNLFGSKSGYAWAKPTVEFRLFEATTHAGEVKANILFALSVVARAKHVRYTIMQDRKSTGGVNAGKELAAWLTRFGWTDEYFKTAKHHILKRVAQ